MDIKSYIEKGLSIQEIKDLFEDELSTEMEKFEAQNQKEKEIAECRADLACALYDYLEAVGIIKATEATDEEIEEYIRKIENSFKRMEKDRSGSRFNTWRLFL